MPLTIAVCIKQVPDTWAEKRLQPGAGVLDRAAADAVLNELDEYAIEEALTLQESHGGEVVVVSMGPARTSETLRKALSMGADRAVHLLDEALGGSDALATSAVLAAAISRIQPDLVLCGVESTDARMSVVPAMLAERLKLAAAERPRRRLRWTPGRSLWIGAPRTAWWCCPQGSRPW